MSPFPAIIPVYGLSLIQRCRLEVYKIAKFRGPCAPNGQCCILNTLCTKCSALIISALIVNANATGNAQCSIELCTRIPCSDRCAVSAV